MRAEKGSAAAVILAACIVCSVFADKGPAPGAGVIPQRGASGVPLEWITANPALLGVEGVQANGYTFMPLSFSFWSDKIATSAFNPWVLTDINSKELFFRYMSFVVNESFGLRGVRGQKEVSRRLTEELRGGITLRVKAGLVPVSVVSDGIGFGMRERFDLDLRLPDGALLPFFSNDAGVKMGEALDFSTFYFDTRWTTEFALRGGWQMFNVPPILEMAGLNKAAFGVGVKYILGHMYIEAEAGEQSRFAYDEENNGYFADMNFIVRTAGTGFYGNWRSRNPFAAGLPIVGWGPGFDAGGALYNDNHIVSFGFEDIGLIVWNGKDRYEVNYKVKKNTFDIVDIITNPNHMFPRDSGDYFPNEEDVLELQTGKPFFTYLPMSMNAGYTYIYPIPDPQWRALADYVSGSFFYQQEHIRHSERVGDNARCTFGVGTGLLYGVFPLRYGITLGGIEKYSTSVSAGLDLRKFTVDASYRSVGSLGFIPERGFDVAVALSARWGSKKKKKAAPAAAVIVPAPSAPAPVPVQPVPVQPVPEQPIPVQPVPVQPVPEQPIPVQPVPVQPVPEQPIPVQPIPVQPVPVQPVPEQPIPVQPIPVQPIPVQPVPEQPIPVQPVPIEQPIPVEPVPVEPVPIQPPIPVQPVPIQPVPVQPVPVQPVPIQPVPIEQPVPVQPVPEESKSIHSPLPPQPQLYREQDQYQAEQQP